jgi:uncharacterized integral membrane protein
MDYLATLMAMTDGPWRSCHTPDVIGLIIAGAAVVGALIGYGVGKLNSATMHG